MGVAGLGLGWWNPVHRCGDHFVEGLAMTTEPVPLTEILNNPEEHYPGNFDTPERANALLTGLCQDAANEIERLNQALHWEQNRAERIGTHGPGCHTWGPAHFECLLRKFNEENK